VPSNFKPRRSRRVAKLPPDLGNESAAIVCRQLVMIRTRFLLKMLESMQSYLSQHSLESMLLLWQHCLDGKCLKKYRLKPNLWEGRILLFTVKYTSGPRTWHAMSLTSHPPPPPPRTQKTGQTSPRTSSVHAKPSKSEFVKPDANMACHVGATYGPQLDMLCHLDPRT
jgi:hypothetical protein